MDTALEFHDVCFRYQHDEVLHNATLRIDTGDLVAVVGPNGGGKSTLIKLALGLLRPHLGTVRLYGAPPAKTRKRVGYVPQYLQFDSDFPISALEVVLLSRAERHWLGSYSQQDREAARDALARVKLDNFEDRSFSALSGGERQRVLIAQALACQPEMLILDEPTANVDTVVEQQIYDLLNELNERLTIIVVSHNLNVVTKHATHVACVNRTTSMVPMAHWTQETMQAVFHGNMAVLQHEDNCHVNDASQALRTPHRGTNPEIDT